MKNNKEKINLTKVFITIICMIFLLVFVTNGKRLIKNTSAKTTVAEGSLSYEEDVEGYLIRDEVVLQGDNYKNGMVRMLSDGERAAMKQSVFRYYSNSEESILSEIEKLDIQINEAIENSEYTLGTTNTDISSLEREIELVINDMHKINNLQKINEHKNKIETYISKKADITGKLSPEGSLVKTLTQERDKLEEKLQNSVEVITAPRSGLASYRVDGLEDKLVIGDFSYLTTDLLKNLELKVGAVVPLSNEKGKIVDNFKCYIATIVTSENAMSAKVGDDLKLRLSTSDEIDAEIVHIVDEGKERIIVFEIDEKVAELLEFRKISMDIVWWEYTGLKVSNSALIEEDDKIYVERKKNGYIEKILVKVLRQNDAYSILENYEEEELKALGYSADEISEREKIKLYDEVLLH